MSRDPTDGWPSSSGRFPQPSTAPRRPGGMAVVESIWTTTASRMMAWAVVSWQTSTPPASGNSAVAFARLPLHGHFLRQQVLEGDADHGRPPRRVLDSIWSSTART
ncbi:MAG: hypothetical protein Q7T33_03800 [Dehalococcoidia bacterium]|nr:hypothetical protein [Dehalococcoidia bacterium]